MERGLKCLSFLKAAAWKKVTAAAPHCRNPAFIIKNNRISSATGDINHIGFLFSEGLDTTGIEKRGFM